ncbi:MAG: DNA-binding protein HU-beta [Candidatus Phytoplasma citri]|nr:MAG: DNA-binding protein HU-beta [Candidatus Phytoplasma aurantifolia]
MLKKTKQIKKNIERDYITKKELIKKIARLVKTSITNTETFYNAFEKTVIQAITTEQPKVIISPKIGFLQLKTSKDRKGFNPNTKEIIKIPASTRIIFKVAGSLKKEVKSLVLEE